MRNEDGKRQGAVQPRHAPQRGDVPPDSWLRGRQRPEHSDPEYAVPVQGDGMQGQPAGRDSGEGSKKRRDGLRETPPKAGRPGKDT